MTRYILNGDTIIDARILLEINLNWQKNQDTFAIYCTDRKSIEQPIKQLEEFGIFPKIIEICANQKYIDIYIDMIRTMRGSDPNEIMIHYILDTIHRLTEPVLFMPSPSTYNLLNISADRIKQMNMTIDDLTAEYNLDPLLVRIDEGELIRNPVVIILNDRDMNHTHDLKCTDLSQTNNRIVISKDHLVNDRVLFSLNGLTDIKIEYISGDPCGAFLRGTRKNLKKKRSARKINWMVFEETFNVEHNNTIFAVHNRNFLYVQIFHKIYRIKDNIATYLFDAV